MSTQPSNIKPNTILVAAGSKMFARVLLRNIKKHCDFETVSVDSSAQAQELINGGQHQFFAGLVNLGMSDVVEDGLVDVMVAKGIPTIILTEPMDDDQRDLMMSKGIVDYVLKEDPAYCLEQIVLLINQLRRNQAVKVMVVDDSRVARMKARRLLEINNFQIVEAADGNQALALLETHPDTRLVLADYHMPEMDGVELVKRIRQHHSRRDLAIIGMSTHGNNLLSSRFLKAGASDFITKPFLEEELAFRINQNIDLLEHIRDLSLVANRDYLTGLLSRRHFFDLGQRIFEQLRHSRSPLTVAMADIDHFKQVNDLHGHDAGDMVLSRIGEILQTSFRGTDLIGRFGGEEFCFLLPEVSVTAATSIFENLRQKVNAMEVILSDQTRITVTLSIGVVCRDDARDLESAVRSADGALYLAKEDGRNRVRFA
jgi:diguanylate cyclase (GGDEF)-like protein